jgi:hypothetical protein
VNPSEEQSELVESVERCVLGRRGALPGLPGGPALGEPKPEISDELVDALLAGASSAQEIAGPDGVLAHLTRRLLNRGLEAELTAHLGYAAGQAPRGGSGNSRNGKPSKTLITDQGPLRISSPRDRKGTFEPQIVKKRQTRWVGPTTTSPQTCATTNAGVSPGTYAGPAPRHKERCRL